MLTSLRLGRVHCRPDALLRREPSRPECRRQHRSAVRHLRLVYPPRVLKNRHGTAISERLPAPCRGEQTRHSSQRASTRPVSWGTDPAQQSASVYPPRVVGNRPGTAVSERLPAPCRGKQTTYNALFNNVRFIIHR